MDIGIYRNVDYSMDEAESRIRASLADEGFGVLTEIDVTATLKTKLDVDFMPYKILGACHPPSAYKALSAVPEIGLLLPCNVTLSQNDDGTIRVGAINAKEMFRMIDAPELEELATEIGSKLENAINAV